MKRSSDRLARFLREDFPVYLRDSKKKGLSCQLSDVLALYRAYRFPPYQYIKHGLYLDEFRGDVQRFMPPELVHRFRDSVNPSAHRKWVTNKSAFGLKMKDCHLPVVETIAEFTRQRTITAPGGTALSYAEFIDHCARDGHATLFFKPTKGGAGSGVFKAEFDGGLLYVGGDRLGEAELFTRMFTDDRHLSYLAQPLIRQHSLLDEIYPNSINTVRIDTLVVGEAVFHDGAALRIGSGEAQADNWALGGFVCGINIETGALASTAISKARYGRQRVTQHPSTGFQFAGVQLPFWEEVKRLVVAGARALLPLHALGWDVAITSEGPLLVEANHDYDVFLLQEVVQGLRDTPLGRAALATPRLAASR